MSASIAKAQECTTPVFTTSVAKNRTPFFKNSVLRKWAIRYSIPALLSAALHAALLLGPSPKKTGLGNATADAISRTELILASPSQAASNPGASSSANSASQSNSAASRPPTEAEIEATVKNALADLFSHTAPEFPNLTDGLVFQSDFDALAALGGNGAGIGSDLTQAFSNGPGAHAFSSTASAGGGGQGALRIAISFMPNPPYPELARREKRQGSVDLLVAVDATGRARTVMISRSSGHSDLDEAARTTVLQQWRFQRALPSDAGNSGETRDCIVKVSFNLERS